MPATVESSPKLNVLSFGPLTWSDPKILSDFESHFKVHTIQPVDRAGTCAKVTEAAKTHGPFYGAIIGMKNGAYERFNGELFGPLLPSLKIVACVNAGYNEFDLVYDTARNRA